MNARRGIKTIIGSFFRKRGQMGAEASSATFLTTVFFVVAIACCAASIVMWWFPYHLFSDEVYNIVVVNSPDSFRKFNEDMQPEFDEMSEYYGDRYDYFTNWENMVDFEYICVGYGWTEFIYKDTDALYDFITFGKWMRENDAYLTVVFPKDFDQMIKDRQNGITDEKPQVLTYFRTNSMEYSDMKKEFVDKYLSLYQSKLRSDYGLKITSVQDSRIEDDMITTIENTSGMRAFADTMSRTFVPILLFVILLYSSMSIGTNVIAGQKERGSFTGILLTPVPRYAIVIGYLGGVVIKTMIPAFFIATISALLAGQFNIVAFLVLYLYVLALAIFIASVTIMISVINDTVVSAQTAFLPIFLILVAVCVTCIQSVSDRADFYMFLPVHGQFYGIGDVLTGNINFPGLIVSSLATLLLTAVMTVVTVRLLHSERYTVSIDTVDAKEVRRYKEGGKFSLFERFNKATDNFSYFITELFYPLVVLSFYQFLAMIPVVVSYMRKPEYSSFIQDLANVGSVEDIMNKTFEIFGIFFKDPLFLVMMTLGYILIIITYFIHAGRVWKIKGIKNKIASCGYPLNNGKHIAVHYGMGFLFGFIMMTCTIGIMIITGQVTLGGFNISAGGIGAFIFNLFMWFPQGASEELMFRGYMIPAFNKRYKVAVGVAVSSIVFSAFHSLNPGFTPLASVNLVLIAVLFALIYLLTGDIWMTSAMHTAWNLTQGNIYGLQVSGNEASNTIIKVLYGSNANPLITGGAFGPEGGLATTAVTAVCLVIVIILLAKKKRTTK
jgi:membrane protease YdiL (CAAX protease family)/ABC-type Na+ efflux pump permease subunit